MGIALGKAMRTRCRGYAPFTLNANCPKRLSKELVVSFQRQRYILQTGGHPRYALERRPGFFVQIRCDGVTGYRYA